MPAKPDKLKKSKTSHSVELLRNRLDDWLQHFLQSPQSHFQDPLECIDKSLSPNDMEIVAFIIAGLSYGRVEQIKKSSFTLLQRLEGVGLKNTQGHGLAKFLIESDEALLKSSLNKALVGWKHRLNTSEDLVNVLTSIARVLKKETSLAQLFQRIQSEHLDPKDQIQNFSASLFPELKIQKKRGALFKKWKGTGVHWFAPQPNDGGTCKRLLMYLRWMIRKDTFDLGCWKEAILLKTSLETPKQENLFVPVDTHILKWAIQEKIVSSKSANWKSVEQITNYFKKINPEDPLKYDFLICHEGMKIFRSATSSRKTL